MALLASVGAQLSKATRGTCPGDRVSSSAPRLLSRPTALLRLGIVLLLLGLLGVLGVHHTPKTV